VEKIFNFREYAGCNLGKEWLNYLLQRKLMIPLRLVVSGTTISVFAICLAVSIFLFVFLTWYLLRKLIKPTKIFDLAIIGVFICFFFSRLFGVLFNMNSYGVDFSKVFILNDPNYSFMGGIIGFILFVIIINKTLLKEEKSHLDSLKKLLLAVIIAFIPFLIGMILSGRMLGLEIKSDFGLQYEDGLKRMPIGIFRLFYGICCLIIFYFLQKGNKVRVTAIYSVFLLIISAFEFVINFFIFDYKPQVFNVINSEQLLCIGIFILGVVLYFGANKPKTIFTNDSDISERKFLTDFTYEKTKTQDIPFSLNDKRYEIKSKDFKPKERLVMAVNKIKRKFKK
jgi:prolipoprotein diacylglyceryltransferase